MPEDADEVSQAGEADGNARGADQAGGRAADPESARPLPPADFGHFVSGVAVQTLMQLGEIENPIHGEKRVDLASAKYSIDLLNMLAEKTSGNLTQDEDRYLKAALHDLRMRYVEAVSGPPPEGEE